MNIKLELVQGKRVLHVVLEDLEIIAFDHLLSRQPYYQKDTP
jgi:hypothetical protein